MSRVAEILAAMRTDTMTVRRAEKYKTNYGETKTAMAVVYENIPCRLSFGGKGKSSYNERIANAEHDAVVFYDSSIAAIKLNDELTILRQGQAYKCRAGTYSIYPSHTELLVSFHDR